MWVEVVCRERMGVGWGEGGEKYGDKGQLCFGFVSVFVCSFVYLFVCFFVFMKNHGCWKAISLFFRFALNLFS